MAGKKQEKSVYEMLERVPEVVREEERCYNWEQIRQEGR